MAQSEESSVVNEGLEGVVAAETRTSMVDGAAGRLVLAGYELEDLAPNANFEQVIHLLLEGRLPSSAEERELCARLAQETLAEETSAILRGGVARGGDVTDVLRMGLASLLPSDDPQDTALTLIGQTALQTAAICRLRAGLEPLDRRGSSLAGRFLEELHGEPPSLAEARGLETYLATVADHGFNASTFTARVIVSTQSDLVSAITGALGALKGPLHGGAPGPVLDTLLEVGRAERAEEVLRAKLERGERLMGFGHRVYEVRDPRAEVLRMAARRLLDGDADLLALADAVEATALRLLRAAKPGRRIETNVEFYTAILLHALRIPSDAYTAVFAVGRVVGWCAHALEQRRTGRLIRPRALYVGPQGRSWPT